MRVQDLQQFLSKFTEGNKDGSRQGNALSNAVIYVEINGYAHKIVRMEVQEHATPIIGHKGHTAHRVVLKTDKTNRISLPPKLQI
jgi:restriction endonuclease Mrr